MKKVLILGGFLALITLIVAVLFLTQPYSPAVTVSAQEDEPEKPERVMEIAIEKIINGEVTSGVVRITFEDPDTLPTQAERAVGVFLGQNGDVFTLGTGSIEVEVDVEVVNDEKPVTTLSVTHSGDPVDVLVTEDTIIYKDTTEHPEITDEDLESGNKVVLRSIEPGSLDEIVENMVLRVWGEVEDGTIIATVLVHEKIY
jgi:hypothetical protein